MGSGPLDRDFQGPELECGGGTQAVGGGGYILALWTFLERGGQIWVPEAQELEQGPLHAHESLASSESSPQARGIVVLYRSPQCLYLSFSMR